MTHDLLAESDNLGIKPMKVPLEPGTHLYQVDAIPYYDIARYHELINLLVFILL